MAISTKSDILYTDKTWQTSTKRNSIASQNSFKNIISPKIITTSSWNKEKKCILNNVNYLKAQHTTGS